ncbi:hypothetical protein TCAL_13686, partial [Tigriopus californicus]
IFGALSACLTMAVAGTCYSKSSVVLPQLRSEHFLGCVLGGFTSDFFGRRISLIIDNITFIISLFLIALAPNFSVMLVGRFLEGVSAASCLVSIPIFVNEISQPEVKGFTSSLNMICYTTGFAFMSILGAMFPWRWAVGIVLIIPLTALVGLGISHETPVWLLRKGREDAALRSMTFYRGNEEVIKWEMERTKRSIADVNIDRDESSLLKMAKRLLRRPDFMKPFLIVLGLVTIMIDCSGLPAFAFYLVPILQESNLPIDPYWCAASLTCYRAFIAIATSGIVARCHRRPVFFASGCAIIFSSGSFSLYYLLDTHHLLDNFPWIKWWPVLSIFVMYTGFSCGYASVIYNYQGELMPLDTRSFGSGLIGLVDNLFLFVLAKSIPSLTIMIGLEGLFSIFFIVTSISMILSYFYLPETFGLNSEEIGDLFKKRTVTENP